MPLVCGIKTMLPGRMFKAAEAGAIAAADWAAFMGKSERELALEGVVWASQHQVH